MDKNELEQNLRTTLNEATSKVDEMATYFKEVVEAFSSGNLNNDEIPEIADIVDGVADSMADIMKSATLVMRKVADVDFQL